MSKKLILKSGMTQYKNQHYDASHGEIDMRKWLYRQLKDFHLNPSDDCCEIFIEESKPIEIVDTFSNLTSGNTVTITEDIATNTIPMVFRNGRYQALTNDYTILGKVFTFLKDFGTSNGASGSEEISIIYKYNE